MDEKNQQLLQRLQRNAREPVASLARALHLSRTAVYERLRRLQRDGVIEAFTVRLNPEYARRQLAAQVMIALAPQATVSVVNALQKMPEIQALHSVSGAFDMMARIHAPSTQEIDQVLDRIGQLDGVAKTQSAIILATKFER